MRDDGTIYLPIGGLGHGEEVNLFGRPETYDVDGELYPRTVYDSAAFYGPSSLLPEDAVEANVGSIRRARL